MSDQQSVISLVAISRNEGDRMRRCLRSVPTYIPLVYVDSASTDDSVAFARSKHATVVELDMSKPFLPAPVRDGGFGALLCTNPHVTFVEFVDRDCELEAEWLGRAAQFLETHLSAAAVCGRRRERFPHGSLHNRQCKEEWNTPEGQADACGGDALMRVDAITQVSGYDPAMIAVEEPELRQRLRSVGWQIWRLNAPMTIHHADMHRFSQYWNRAIRSVFGDAQVMYKTRASAGDLLYPREVIGALFWTLGIASAVMVSAAIFGPDGLLAASTIWLLQLLRLGRREDLAKGGHVQLGKIAETAGILRFVTGKVRGSSQGAIFYK